MIDPTTLSQANLWGLVLAGGEGKRLECYVRQLRAERSIPRKQILAIIYVNTFSRAGA